MPLHYKAIALPAELSGLILPFPHVFETLKGLMLELVLFLFLKTQINRKNGGFSFLSLQVQSKAKVESGREEDARNSGFFCTRIGFADRGIIS